MEKRIKIIYWVATGLLCSLMLFSASMYFLNTAEVSEIFINLGYNARIVIPLATAKILGVVAIVSSKSKTLKEWAYFGFLVDLLLALEAHISAQDDGHVFALVGLAFWLASYTYGKKVYPSK